MLVFLVGSSRIEVVIRLQFTAYQISESSFSSETHLHSFFQLFQALAKADQAKISADESSSKVGGALDTVNDILRQLGKCERILRCTDDFLLSAVELKMFQSCQQ